MACQSDMDAYNMSEQKEFSPRFQDKFNIHVLSGSSTISKAYTGNFVFKL